MYRTDFLDTQILVVPVELEAKIAAYHSVSVELGQCLILKSASTGGFYVTQESFHTANLVH